LWKVMKNNRIEGVKGVKRRGGRMRGKKWEM
jgi:hypothetical protein